MVSLELVVAGLCSPSRCGDLRGLGEDEDIPGDTLTTEEAFGDGADDVIVFFPMLSGS